MSPLTKSSILIATLALSACATTPTSPSVMVLPGTGKSFDQFRADDQLCRQYAYEQIGGPDATAAADNRAIGAAAVGTTIGAVAGAAFGGHNGAAAGAGAGLLFGSAAGAGQTNASDYNAQRRYDFSYQQCMYAKGNNVPVSGRFAPRQSPQPDYAPSYSYAPPPPPPGYSR